MATSSAGCRFKAAVVGVDATKILSKCGANHVQEADAECCCLFSVSGYRHCCSGRWLRLGQLWSEQLLSEQLLQRIKVQASKAEDAKVQAAEARWLQTEVLQASL